MYFCDNHTTIKIISLHFCAGFDWDGVNFLHSSLYGAMFWISAENSVDNTGMFSLLLSSAYTAPGPLLVLTPRRQRGGWGCKSIWEGTPADQRDIPHHMTMCSAITAGGRRRGVKKEGSE